MSDEPKEEPKNDDPPKTDPPKADPPKDDDDNKSVTKGDVKNIIKETLKELRGPSSDGPGSRRVDLEEAAKRAVEEASSRLEADKKEKERDAKLDKLEKIVETPPVKLGRLTKVFWGDPGKDAK